MTGCNQYPGYVEETIPVGPLTVAVRLDGLTPRRVLLRVAEGELKPKIEDDWAVIQIESLAQHELIIWE